jgi:hypothetical protein
VSPGPPYIFRKVQMTLLSWILRNKIVSRLRWALLSSDPRYTDLELVIEVMLIL